MKNIKILLLIVLALPALSALAQKLPGIQKQSIRAPKNVKIDGKITEWGNMLQAYNHAIQAYYTVANDDKKIYLVIKSDKRNITNKIINGGVSFTIIKNGKKDVTDGPTITYPVYSWQNHPSIKFIELDELKDDEKDAAKKKDSLLTISNKNLEDKAKYIRVKGVKDVDTLISIYNTNGIKALSALDDKMNYVLELAIDLKVFNITATDLKTFTYNIKFNGIQDYVPGIDVQRDESGTITAINIISRIANNYSGVSNATDCWGTYTIKK